MGGGARAPKFRPPRSTPLRSTPRLRNFKVFPGFTKDFSFHVPPQRANPGEHVMLAEIREREPKGKTCKGDKSARIDNMKTEKAFGKTIKDQPIFPVIARSLPVPLTVTLPTPRNVWMSC